MSIFLALSDRNTTIQDVVLFDGKYTINGMLEANLYINVLVM